MGQFTTEWHLAYQAKQAASLGKACDAVDAVTDEGELHRDVLEYCKQQGWIVFHGSMAHRALRSIGEPDCTIIADKGRVFFCELKTKTGKLSTEQQALKFWASKLGTEIYTIRSMSEFIVLVTPAPVES